MRGCLQLEWDCPDELRAGTQRDWLELQLQGRGYVADLPPEPGFSPQRGVWVTVCNVRFNTVAEGDIVKTLALTRMGADPFIAPGSWVQFHSCPHDEGSNGCAGSVVRTVKP